MNTKTVQFIIVITLLLVLALSSGCSNIVRNDYWKNTAVSTRALKADVLGNPRWIVNCTELMESGAHERCDDVILQLCDGLYNVYAIPDTGVNGNGQVLRVRCLVDIASK